MPPLPQLPRRRARCGYPERGARRAAPGYRRGLHHGQARGAERRQRDRLRQVPAPPHRRARLRARPVRRRRARADRGAHDLRHHRFGRSFAQPVARARVRAGGHRQQARRRDAHPPDRRGHRARRRGRQDHLLRPGHRAAHERYLRRRHGRVHRSDGDAFALRRLGPQRARQGRRDHLPHRQPLRRVRQDRRAAPAQRGARAPRTWRRASSRPW